MFRCPYKCLGSFAGLVLVNEGRRDSRGEDDLYKH